MKHSNLPLSLAWEAFGIKNGAPSLESLRTLITKFRSTKPPEHDPVIGCTILTDPFFLRREDWIPAPSNWAASIVQGKSYDSGESVGQEVWMAVHERLARVVQKDLPPRADGASASAEEVERYGSEFLTRARLGQGTFRVLVTEAYTRRCAITGERTLPVLEAAHIQPFSSLGPHATANGLLLRSDLHKLFDSGYLTVTPDLSVEVSRKIKEEFENGRDYYAMDGRKLAVLPSMQLDRPSSQFLEWHNSNIYLG